jgi:hypothetical protein
MTTKSFELFFLDSTQEQIKKIEADRSKKGLIQQIKKALRHLIQNPAHPGLKSHPMKSFDEIYGVKVFSSYVQNNTPQAYRILWSYGPKAKQITILAILPHY